MSAIRYYTSCGDSTSTTGTGPFTLTGGAPTGCRSITSTLSDGDVVYYRAQTTDGTSWEDINGTYTASGTTLSRTTTLASSNGGSAVSFPSGTKYIYIINPAETLSAQVLTTNGDLLYSDGTTLQRLSIGSTAQSLKVFGGIPAWSGAGNYLTADVTTFSTSFVDVTGMTFSVGANEVWEFRFEIIGANVNAVNCQLAINGPSTPTAISATLVQLYSTVSVKRVAGYDAAFTPTIEPGGTYLYVVSGLIRNGSNAGTFALRMKSLDGNEAGVGANSFFSAQRLV